MKLKILKMYLKKLVNYFLKPLNRVVFFIPIFEIPRTPKNLKIFPKFFFTKNKMINSSRSSRIYLLTFINLYILYNQIVKYFIVSGTFRELRELFFIVPPKKTIVPVIPELFNS